MKEQAARFVCKADPTGEQVIETMALIVTNSIPRIEGDDYHEAYDSFFMAEAGRIMEVLAALPLGTRHQLLIKMLQDKLCLFRVAE